MDKYKEFYGSYEWRAVRYDALVAADGKCQLCGRSKHDGIILNVDHIIPLRKEWLKRTLLSNLQVLCHECNHGKGNRDHTDWRSDNPKVRLTKSQKNERRKARRRKREKMKKKKAEKHVWQPGPASKCRRVSIDEWLEGQLKEKMRQQQ